MAKRLLVTYIIMLLLLPFAYWWGRENMLWFAPYITFHTSNITLNFVLFLFLYGIVCDKYTKHMSRRKGWIIWLVGFVVIIIVFRFIGGYETVIG